MYISESVVFFFSSPLVIRHNGEVPSTRPKSDSEPLLTTKPKTLSGDWGEKSLDLGMYSMRKWVEYFYNWLICWFVFYFLFRMSHNAIHWRALLIRLFSVYTLCLVGVVVQIKYKYRLFYKLQDAELQKKKSAITNVTETRKARAVMLCCKLKSVHSPSVQFSILIQQSNNNDKAWAFNNTIQLCHLTSIVNLS